MKNVKKVASNLLLNCLLKTRYTILIYILAKLTDSQKIYLEGLWVPTVKIEEAGLNKIEEQNITNTIVWKILRCPQLNPYHMQRVQSLLSRAFPFRVHWCTYRLFNLRFLTPYAFYRWSLALITDLRSDDKMADPIWRAKILLSLICPIVWRQKSMFLMKI